MNELPDYIIPVTGHSVVLDDDGTPVTMPIEDWVNAKPGNGLDDPVEGLYMEVTAVVLPDGTETEPYKVNMYFAEYDDDGTAMLTAIYVSVVSEIGLPANEDGILDLVGLFVDHF